MKKSLKINAVLNIIKQLCTVIFPLISIPYIIRVLGPANYGIYNFGNSVVSYFSLLAALGINSYATREGVAYRNRKEDINLFSSQVFSINLISTIFSYILLVVTLLLPNLQPYKKVIAIQSLVIILTTIGADWINTIHEDFAYITLRYIVFQIISIVCMFFFVKRSEDYIVYAGIVVGAQAGANILNFFHVRKYVKIRFTLKIDWKKHIKPILIFFANNVAITIYVNSDITMLGLMRNDVEVGLYSMASKIYSIVKQLLNAIMIVTLPRLSLLIKKDDMLAFHQLSVRIKKALIILVFPMTTGMCFLSREIIAVIGGEKYLSGYVTLIILSFAIIFSMLATYYSSCVMIPIGLEKYILIATVISALANICLNFFFIPYMGFNGAAVTTLISETIVFAICFYICKKNSDDHIEVSGIVKVIFGCSIIALICFLVTKTYMNNILKIVVSMVMSVPAYFLFEITIRNRFLISEISKGVKGIRKKEGKY